MFECISRLVGVLAKAIEQLNSLTVGHVSLGLHGASVGTVKQQVHDGDTIIVKAIGNFGVRFLGVDAPEISFTLPGEKGFTGLNNPKWEVFLSNPLAGFNLEAGLTSFLQSRVGQDAAANHHRHAAKAQEALEREVTKDMMELNKSKEDFEFFMAFAIEIMDRYGRLLGFINRNQPQGDRPVDYNGRLLKEGFISPYFIWPNVNPFRRAESIKKAVIPPGQAKNEADGDNALRQARGWVRSAREQGLGIFDHQDPLRLEPFEVRFLAGRRPPNRWVIDLSRNDDELIPPQKYHTVANSEDRLFIPEEYVPLFMEAGWTKGT